MSQVATNPAVRLQTEGVLSALLGTIAVLLSIKALQPPISGTHPCRVYVCACVDVAWRPVERWSDFQMNLCPYLTHGSWSFFGLSV